MSGAHAMPKQAATTFLPAMTVQDALAVHWLRAVTLRLRREVCWLWRERGLLSGASQSNALLPPYIDRLSNALDLARYAEEKRAFFASDETACYLTEQLDSPAPIDCKARGGFTWVALELALQPVDCFVLALALTPVVDSAAGSVFAACLNDSNRQTPNLALAQRLWEAPQELLALADPAHRLYRYGLLTGATLEWETPLSVPAPVAQQLLFPDSALPAALQALPASGAVSNDLELTLTVARLKSAAPERARIVPLVGASRGAAAHAAALASVLERPAVQPTLGARASDVATLMTLAWLRGSMLHLPISLFAGDTHDSAVKLPLPVLPVTILLALEDRAALKHLPSAHTLPALSVPGLDYAARLARWREGLPLAQRDAEMDRAIADCARRFRYEAEAIDRICQVLKVLGHPPRARDLYRACRADVDLGELAQALTPRFTLDELMLPAKQTTQLTELIRATGALTQVHYEWGTARAWGEAGLSALFAGPPGTGKTMAAEAIARCVDMPLYRIDLSQVVNKYIGETEKNLRRLFDTADAADVILFFDEADALFGKRTEVKDAHDRYANLEVSYLLERMERFKGLAILATNRKKDLDEAFLRRLRCLVEFPLPAPAERLRIWRTVVPAGVDATALEFDFLAQRFALAGGHIRSIVFHACLQSAVADGPRRLEMPAVIRAVKRELDKLGRASTLDQFGRYAELVED